MQCKSNENLENVREVNSSAPSVVIGSEDEKKTESYENFQTFMYELFEKKGVLNDLRAYLRGHIVGLLRSSRTGDQLPCQKHFTQRLELPYQALNMLIAEYLLTMEFNYTLSVFISEMPLANMVFGFAKSLLQGNQSRTALRFKDEDIWSILNYLEVQCDSEHTSNILDMYRRENHLPLLLCMMQCTPVYNGPTTTDQARSSQDSISSSFKSSDYRSQHTSQVKCKHTAFCKVCRGKMLRVREKYREKKKNLAKIMMNPKSSKFSESLLKNIELVENNCIDEMFQQLKSVYEAELDMVKSEEGQRVKRSLVIHGIHLQKKRTEMEEKYRARELELERNVQQKKRFLWGLAQMLREQHKQIAAAMQDVQDETARLTAKEDSLKTELAEAEKVLKQRGEDMRNVISNELTILEGHLDSMKRERDVINKERAELEHMKYVHENSSKMTNPDSTKEDLRSHYDLLKNEFSILKVYLESAKLEPKCVIERSTTTEPVEGTCIEGALNNGRDLDRSRSEDRVKPKRVVNDLKKMKNVNFSQKNRESTSSSSDEPRNDRKHLSEENERLRIFVQQQREYIEDLTSQQVRLAAELTAARAPHILQRPSTAPARGSRVLFNGNVLPNSASTADISRGHGWRKGAGEELSFFANAQPRIIVPGDTIPFIGVVNNRHTDSRRYLINQWRSLRCRAASVDRTRAGVGITARDRYSERANSAGPSVRMPSEDNLNDNEKPDVVLEYAFTPTREPFEQEQKNHKKVMQNRDVNAKLLIREAKETITSKDYNSRHCIDGYQSSNTVLRDAKLRLKKLEIEAEAVEKSYLDFRKKQDAKRKKEKADEVAVGGKEMDPKQDMPPSNTELPRPRVDSTSFLVSVPTAAFEQIIEDIDEYQARYDISLSHFQNKTATPQKIKPIPSPYSCNAAVNSRNQNYLETPLPEFRKYYQSEKRPENYSEEPPTTSTENIDINEKNFYISKSPTNESISPLKNRKDNETRNLKRVPPKSDKNGLSSPKNRENSSDSTSVQSEVNTRSRSSQGRRSPKTIKNKDITKHKELEILKQNICKIYNLSQKTMVINNEDFEEVVQIGQDFSKRANERKGIIEETITESKNENGSDPGSEEHIEDNNLLKIELENVTQVNDVKNSDSQPQDLLVVESSVTDVGNSEPDMEIDLKPPQMTIVVSPKIKRATSIEIAKSAKNGDGGNNCEKSIEMTDNEIMNAIYQADGNVNMSSTNIQMDNSKDVLVPFLSDLDINDPDYSDDFSAEVERNSVNYDTDQELSPISLAKTSEEENFWEV